jgi:hypothetical protein
MSHDVRDSWGRFSAIVAGLVALALLFVTGPLVADEVTLPVSLQIDLLVKVAGYDRNIAARAGDRVRIAIVAKAGNEEAAKVAAVAEKALADKDVIAGLPHEQSVVRFADAAGLAQLCRARRLAIVYLTPGFSDAEVLAIAAALDGVDVLSVASVASYVPRGIVLGFDLVSSKPKLLVHLGQARKQHVNLSAEVLKLMTVYE